MRSRWVGILVALTLVGAAVLAPNSAIAGDDFLTTACNANGVAPAAADQKDVNGQPIVPRAADGKKSVPVILVHGFDGGADVFSKPINLFADGGDGGDGVQIPFSFIGQLQKTPGLAVYTFDYSEYSNRWVTDSNIGPRLAQAIECLTNHYGTKAQIVAHSMGGLATRYALDQNDSTGVKISSRVSGVSTFGTPNTGSEIATAVSDALGLNSSTPPPSASVLGGVRLDGWLLASICGRQITAGKDSLTPPCNQIPSWAAGAIGLDSDAGRAMRVGSPQLAALPAWPTGIPVTAIDGSTLIHGITLFGVGSPDNGIDAGDIIVPSSSAAFGGTSTKELSCGYALLATNLSGLVVKSMGTKLVTNGPITGLMGDNPCFHGNLLRTINGTNVAADAVRAAAKNPQPIQTDGGGSQSPSPTPTASATDGPGWYPLQAVPQVGFTGSFKTRDVTIRTTLFPESLVQYYPYAPPNAPPEFIDWALKGLCTKLEVAVGIDAESGIPTGNATFTVFLDDHVAAQAQHGYYDEPQHLSLDISGVTRLRLQAGFPPDSDIVPTWGSPKVYCFTNPSPNQ
ncbi:NPCBM/NEW2 domain-containing protein [Arthrobacter bambusae]|uniref:Pimeloyl-ACP methyl ester carboxylesterase n=1 Tax=Arthrobacter bambusae TaxID=1338426 RepID=A0AAW8DKL0_9MICC|nr:NPCBM/NEW2 domain-containing protein [Arthrobacter bambusae]MDP9905598.1 pimeloyl-ACP methyl ester carboxylesterase [Arthrobacter bambusae]MDQ0127320.1 pimeloyl-ACP methyl ester carboxylesterase [Arthrobacter bambusae]MDQ0178662.1 pimeloyl-ACP methyl ester carboxylesterase [Arthrobacter bambusae]